jgi:hypothetical protein
MFRTCAECGSQFEILPSEEEYFRATAARMGGAWALPTRCLPCRAARRRARYAEPVSPGRDEHLLCVQCFQTFVFGGRDLEFFAARGFSKPKRCRPCRQARREGVGDGN